MAIVRAVDGKYRLEYPMGKLLAEFPWAPLALRIAPDGQRVAYANYTVGNRMELFIVDRGGKVIDLGLIAGQTSEPEVAPLCWTPDGREIWHRSYDTRNLNTIYARGVNGPAQSRAFPAV